MEEYGDRTAAPDLVPSTSEIWTLVMFLFPENSVLIEQKREDWICPSVNTMTFTNRRPPRSLGKQQVFPE